MVRIFIYFCLVIALFLSAGCSASEQDSKVQPIQEKAQEKVTVPEKQAREQEAAKALATYLYENFGGAGDPKYATSWYSSIKSIRVELESDGQANVLVNTDYIAGKKDKLAEKIASTIATAIAGSSVVDVKSVTVFGQNGIVGSWSFFRDN
ncbi:MAG: hypothetical protein JRD89_04060 [Deltaproteobacteria bacterium]|nr:hypothetical protein [Deltaproteobacteria bacterium]